MVEREHISNNIPNMLRLALGFVVFEPNLLRETINKASRQITPNGIKVMTTTILSNPDSAKTNFGRNNTKYINNKARI